MYFYTRHLFVLIPLFYSLHVSQLIEPFQDLTILLATIYVR